MVRRVLQQFNLCHHINAVAAGILSKLIAFERNRHRLCAHQLLAAVVYTDNRELERLAGGLERFQLAHVILRRLIPVRITGKRVFPIRQQRRKADFAQPRRFQNIYLTLVDEVDGLVLVGCLDGQCTRRDRKAHTVHVKLVHQICTPSALVTSASVTLASSRLTTPSRSISFEMLL